ncbi:MAG TPA: glutamate 5-kinase [Enteractinococcus helveticum]|uniref:Glutamate 5-kinase n=2 Tax=Enteractinococcus helveticum TaxID=1837282 RepID=A0A921K6V4_9MICC|nr:glutamate 5-kinase [Enteractinococcus helveticum]HJF13837.1 glutamate 5-kinase [Enteractinococcus helveticum]
MPNPVTDRTKLRDARRIVVKIGSSSLTDGQGGVSVPAIDTLTRVVSQLYHDGAQVVLVSSGAIAAGFRPLGLDKRPKDLATQQAAAAVGQSRLMAQYTESFWKHSISVAQVLLTAEDLMRRTQYNNAFRSLNRLLNLGVLPVVNENDAVATHEIRFGDNDRLASLVAAVIKADVLFMLSDVDALYDGPPTQPGARRIANVSAEANLAHISVGDSGSSIGTGGMVTKLQAASIATDAGIPTFLTSAENAQAAIDGQDIGTWFASRGERKSARNAWLEHMAISRGSIMIDDGAAEAITVRHRSLLPAGLIGVSGTFEAGDVVEITNSQGTVIARGLTNYSVTELPAMVGKSTRQLRDELGPEYDRVVIHTDDTVIVKQTTLTS